jgi:hypothetical protein
MKAILKTKKKLSFSIKLTGLIVFLITIVSATLSIKYVGKSKTIYPELIVDTKIPAPQCISKGGFYDQAFSITLHSLHGTKVYYTLDGTKPTLQSKVYILPVLITNRTNETNTLADIPTSPRWKPPIGNIFKGTTVRAICVTNDNKKSEELIRTFFINEKGNLRYNIPIMAITVDPDDLFGYKNGIYVLGKNYEDKRDYVKKQLNLDLPWWEYPSNYLKRGNNSERPVYIEFYEPHSNIGFNEKAGVRVNGNATRGFAQKSLRIYFDKQYGMDHLNYKLFPESSITNYNSFILRNGGNDWNKTMFRDALIQSIMKQSTLNTQAYRPAIVFINAEYWGIHNIRERFDENYIANKYHISTDSISILELGGDLLYGKKNDTKEFKNLLQFIKTNDLSLDSNYNRIEKLIDIDNFMDFVIANVYFCNSDWPNNNVKFWRYRAPPYNSDTTSNRDGRWRWTLYDTDWGLGYTSRNAVQLNLLEKAKETGSIGVIFGELLKNKRFTAKFLLRFDCHLKNTFKSENVIIKINEFEKELAPEMEEHINRWRAIGSYSNWLIYIQELKDFATMRPTIQAQQLKKFIENK